MEGVAVVGGFDIFGLWGGFALIGFVVEIRAFLFKVLGFEES